VVELYSDKLELVRQKVGGGEDYEDSAGNGALWRAVFYLPGSLGGLGMELGELPGALAAPQNAFFDFFERSGKQNLFHGVLLFPPDLFEAAARPFGTHRAQPRLGECAA
jgi:hypothetical protein